MRTEYDRPTSVTVFGILNIVFGSLGLVSMPAGVLGILFITKAPEFGASYGTWLIISQIVGLFLNSSLLALGIGLLKKTTWARRGCVIYSWFALGSISVSVLVTAIVLVLILSPGKDPVIAAGIFGGFFGLIFAIPYPILLMIFMRKQRVREYFGD